MTLGGAAREIPRWIVALRCGMLVAMGDGMDIKQARAVIADLARQDVGNPEGDDYSRHGSARIAIDQWRRAAGEAGDLGVVEAIDALGALGAAQVYESARVST